MHWLITRVARDVDYSSDTFKFWLAAVAWFYASRRVVRFIVWLWKLVR
jgi:hypothetical protein